MLVGPGVVRLPESVRAPERRHLLADAPERPLRERVTQAVGHVRHLQQRRRDRTRELQLLADQRIRAPLPCDREQILELGAALSVPKIFETAKPKRSDSGIVSSSGKRSVMLTPVAPSASPTALASNPCERVRQRQHRVVVTPAGRRG